MDNSTQREEMLMRYIDGLMGAEEKTAFEKLLAGDSALREELEGLQLATASVKSFGLKRHVAGLHEKMMKERNQVPVKQISPGRRILRRIVAVAASIVFIILVWQGLVFYNLSANKVYDANYISYVPDITRSNGAAISDVEKAYLDKDYQKVTEFTRTSENNAELMMAGHSHLALNNAGAAITAFKKVAEGPASDLKESAEYNLILSYIRNKDYDLALELMNRVEGNPDHLYHDKMTAKLFRQVKMLKWR